MIDNRDAQFISVQGMGNFDMNEFKRRIES